MSLREVRQARAAQARRYTVREASSYMGVSSPTYHKWEENPGKLTLEQAQRLAEYLDCSADDIFLPTKHN